MNSMIHHVALLAASPPETVKTGLNDLLRLQVAVPFLPGFERVYRGVHQLDAIDDCFNMHDGPFLHDLAVDLGSWSLQRKIKQCISSRATSQTLSEKRRCVCVIIPSQQHLQNSHSRVCDSLPWSCCPWSVEGTMLQMHSNDRAVLHVLHPGPAPAQTYEHRKWGENKLCRFYGV